MATNLELNNAGGRTLIGNYAEERHLAEQLGLQTNYNKGVELNASLEFSTGNAHILAPAGAELKGSSVQATSYTGTQPVQDSVGPRQQKAALSALAQAQAEMEAEEAAAAVEAATQNLQTTTSVHFSPASAGVVTRPIAEHDPELATLPIATVYSAALPAGRGHGKSTLFTDGMKNRREIDMLVASGQL